MTTYRIPRPSWRLTEFENDTVKWEPYFDELNRKVWELEESVLTSAVVDLLRSKGWTVEAPERGDDEPARV